MIDQRRRRFLCCRNFAKNFLRRLDMIYWQWRAVRISLVSFSGKLAWILAVYECCGNVPRLTWVQLRCVVGDLTGEGHGTSKKSAKHQAAENVLTQLKSGVVPGEEKLPIKGDELEKDQSMIHAGEINPIGTLQVRDEPHLPVCWDKCSGNGCFPRLAPAGLLSGIWSRSEPQERVHHLLFRRKAQRVWQR